MNGISAPTQQQTPSTSALTPQQLYADCFTNLLNHTALAVLSPEDNLDFIIDTVAVPHDLDPFLSLLRLNGTMVLVGIARPQSEPT